MGVVPSAELSPEGTSPAAPDVATAADVDPGEVSTPSTPASTCMCVVPSAELCPEGKSTASPTVAAATAVPAAAVEADPVEPPGVDPIATAAGGGGVRVTVGAADDGAVESSGVSGVF